MTKEELIARLKALGVALGREISLAGSKDELALRVAELEEELEGLGDDGEEAGSGLAEQAGPQVDGPAVALIPVTTRIRIHIDDPLMPAGTLTHLTPTLANQLTMRGLVC